MKKIFLLVLILTFGFCFSSTFATWQIADPYHGTKSQSVWFPERLTQSDLPNRYVDNKTQVFLKPGLLKDNIEEAAKKHHWLIQWDASDNYPLLVDTKLTGPDFPSVMNQLLSHYPLKARYDKKTQVMVVTSVNHRESKKTKKPVKPKIKSSKKKQAHSM